MLSSPAVANGVIYVGALNDTVYGLDASIGAALWSATVGSGNGDDSSPAVANGMVYVGSTADNLNAFGLP